MPSNALTGFRGLATFRCGPERPLGPEAGSASEEEERIGGRESPGPSTEAEDTGRRKSGSLGATF
jgi:hypothetical protein